MKVIISHDVDHLYLSEHLFDGVQLKLFARSVLERMNQVISAGEYGKRLDDLLKNQWHHVDELMDFDEANKIPSTFFFAMAKGKGLNYSRGAVIPVINRVVQRGFDCGVHGIAFEDQQKISSEYLAFKEICGISGFGIRMHYLRMDENTLEKFDQVGYLFDSSEYADKAPYRIGKMWEFPLHIMDSNEFYQGNSVQKEKIEGIIEKTRNRILKLEQENIPYLTLLFHDRYYCEAFQSYHRWYETIVTFLSENGHEFIGYRQAIGELSQKEMR